MDRIGTGNAELDSLLGGGFLPGKNVLIYGATGVGKSVLGTQIAHAGLQAEGHPGAIIDLAGGLDDQAQRQYATDLFSWIVYGWSAVPPGAEWESQELDRFAYTEMGLSEIAQCAPGQPPVCKEDFLRHHLQNTRRIILDGSDPVKPGDLEGRTAQLRAALTTLRTPMAIDIEKRHQNTGPLDNPAYWNSKVRPDDITAYLEGRRSGAAYGHRPKEPRSSLDRRGPDVWDRAHLGIAGGKGSYGVNVRRVKTDPSSQVVVILQTTEERSFLDLMNRSADAHGLDAHVNTVLVMGYLPVTGQSLEQQRAIGVVKHRGSPYKTTGMRYAIAEGGIRPIL
jgi:hypothetical protein